ncbi:hypothetical protein L228DRAFT_279316 [Xylona heveae TC161]|uniref:Dynactin subunit 6 n=1 Tax=Xylona heveae (strain CBS 132557 / TC161) TaxID=1328760 RepID=A0A165JCX6_XYLHT|nr:hypothetical protein L228DRAFT_279316 [Xylona heveae TC161]KZF26068.1 hypothetical protein L228DRAFT_279316 [Xylona heveae TC161]
MSTATPARRSAVPPPPRPPVKVYPGAVFPESSIFMIGYYPLTIEPHAVVHPRVRFTTLHGPVRIGPGAIISEKSMIGVQYTEQKQQKQQQQQPEQIPPATRTTVPGQGQGQAQEQGESSEGEKSQARKVESVTLERGVIIEPGAYVEAELVREGTVIEAGAKIGRGCHIGRFCKICPYITIPPGENLPDYTVVYGNGEGERRIDHAGATEPGLDELRLRMSSVHVNLLKKLVQVPPKKG